MTPQSPSRTLIAFYGIKHGLAIKLDRQDVVSGLFVCLFVCF